MRGKPRRSGGGLMDQMQSRAMRILIQYRSQQPQTQFWRQEDWSVDYLRDTDPIFRRMKAGQLHLIAQQAIAGIEIESPPPTDNESSEEEENVTLIEVQDSNFMNRSLRQTYLKSNNPISSPQSSQEDEGIDKDEQQTNAPANGEPLANEPPSKSNIKQPQQQLQRPAKKRKLPGSTTGNQAVDYSPPNVRYSDLGGIEKCIEEIRELIEAPLRHPEIYRHLNICPPRGVLLHGPPGCGKTQLARAVAGEVGVPFIQISAPSVVSGMSGESEKKIREVFAEAQQLAPCIVFIDEIDAITPKRETAQREMERRIVAQLLTSLDDLSIENTGGKPVIVIGATNRPDSLDEALRRAGRFDREIALGVPDERARESILRVLTAKLRLAGDFDFPGLAKLTPGYVGADLQSLTTAAGVIAVKRIFGILAASSDTNMNMEVDEESTLPSIKEPLTDIYREINPSPISEFLRRHPEPLNETQLEPLSIIMQDFMLALRKVQPSSKREGFATVPDVSWSDIGALSEIQNELRMSIVEQIKRPELFRKVGIINPCGVLLWGPPGCGKTLLAKAVANESHCNFISVKGPELLNKYVGESERGVRQVFARARASAPCVIFFDELDALCPRRGGGSDSQTSERVVNQLLTELDGLESRKNVYVIAATNRPDVVDRAILRPGRFDKLLHVRLPTAAERLDILRTLTKRLLLSGDVELRQLAQDKRCDRFSGADLSSLIREAGMAALKETLANNFAAGDADACKTDASIEISRRHFNQAFSKCQPSVTEQDLRSYESMEKRLGLSATDA